MINKNFIFISTLSFKVKVIKIYIYVYYYNYIKYLVLCSSTLLQKFFALKLKAKLIMKNLSLKNNTVEDGHLTEDYSFTNKVFSSEPNVATRKAEVFELR